MNPPVDPQAHYDLARKALGLDPEADDEAAQVLSHVLDDIAQRVVDPMALAPQLEGRATIVLGPAPGGIEDVRALPPTTPLVVAGSAVAAAFHHDLHPRLVVTDLDGYAAAHKALSRRGAVTAVHAHGDNVQQLRSLVPELPGPVFGTCQVPPPSEPVALHRFGGFTDGDRACFLAAALGASEIRLAGWDLDEPVGGGEGKKVKLGIARKLLEEVGVGVEVVERGRDPDQRP